MTGNHSEQRSFNRKHIIMKHLDSKRPGGFCVFVFYRGLCGLRAGF